MRRIYNLFEGAVILNKMIYSDKESIGYKLSD
nr:MAG TPA: hypothetical protein [Caudoviricetes sp.]